MKILVIRGKDLASLAGEFELRLSAPPLAGVGLFAITGPTGAGKSTLLDALCLALFDRTPRLHKKGGGGLVGRDPAVERLHAMDRRSLLRVGAATAVAEVEFLGADGRHYRSTWTAWRARERADGTLQPQALRLVDVATGTQLGEGKEGTLAQIEQRLGLDFDQFRRSVLLAQGDFAAFLGAKGEERAALLERMTGTGIYRELSIAAHLRAARERAALLQLEEQAGRLAPLPAQAREAREAELAVARSEQQAVVGSQAAAERDVAHFRELARLAAGEAEAALQLGATEAALVLAAPRLAELAAVEAAHVLRGAVEAADAAAARATRSVLGAATSGQEAVASRERASAGEQAALAALERERAERTAREAAGPELERARLLDAALATAAREAQESTALALEAQEAARAASSAAAAQALACARARAEEAKEVEALAAGAASALLTAQWERWRVLLQREVERAGRRSLALQEGARLEVVRAAASLEQERATALALEAGTALAGAQAALVAAQGEGTEALAAAAAARREAAEARARSLQGLARLVPEHGAVARLEAEAAQQAAVALLGAERARLELQQEGASALHAAALCDEAGRALELARRQASLAELRPSLKDGEPCPLCGATAHPHAADAAPLPALLAGQEARVRELQALAATHRGNAAAARERVEQLGLQAAQASSVRAAQVTLRTLHEGRWSELLAALRNEPRLPAHPAAAGAGEALAQACRDAELGLLAARHEEQTAHERLRRARAARETLDTARARAEALFAEVRRLSDAAAQATRDLAAHDASHARDAAQGEAAARELSEGLAGGPTLLAALAADPAGVLARCEVAVVARRDQARRRDEAHASAVTLAAAAERAAVVLEAASGQATVAAEAARVRGEKHASLAEARRGLLSGRSVAQVEEPLAAASALAAQQAARAVEAREQLARAAAAAEAAAAAARDAAAQVETEAAAASATLSAALRAAGLGEQPVRQRLGRDVAWLVRERAELAALTVARAGAAAVRDDWSRQREQLLAAPGPACEETEAVERAAQAAAEGTRLGQIVWAIAHSLEEDDALRKQQQALAPELVAARARDRLWGGLGELIGHNKGATFQHFAQSLTLDGLLAAANDHLRELSPRYRLERVPGADLDLQVVDAQLGEEVRGVQSLSGGESFLVSLALALGLSSMVAGQARVDSLFIDEGFGSLDPATLETVLSALDALQSGGRQVGLISHVPGLAERIGVQVRVRPTGGGRSSVEVVVA